MFGGRDATGPPNPIEALNAKVRELTRFACHGCQVVSFTSRMGIPISPVIATL